MLDGHGNEIGRVEGDEFVRCGTRPIYRIDGPALYSMDGSARLMGFIEAVSYTHLRAHETSLHLVCRLLLEKKK